MHACDSFSGDTSRASQTQIHNVPPVSAGDIKNSFSKCPGCCVPSLLPSQVHCVPAAPHVVQGVAGYLINTSWHLDTAVWMEILCREVPGKFLIWTIFSFTTGNTEGGDRRWKTWGLAPSLRHTEVLPSALPKKQFIHAAKGQALGITQLLLPQQCCPSPFQPTLQSNGELLRCQSNFSYWGLERRWERSCSGACAALQCWNGSLFHARLDGAWSSLF